MSSIIAAVKLLVLLQRLIELALESIAETRNTDEREALKTAVAEAKLAKTKEEKIAAAKKIRDAFRAPADS